MNEPSKCLTFSTCQKATKHTEKIKACWDNLGKLTFDPETKLFCKEKFGITICYDMGECECGEIYLEKERLTRPFVCWLCQG
jgi:hypothetical protein